MELNGDGFLFLCVLVSNPVWRRPPCEIAKLMHPRVLVVLGGVVCFLARAGRLAGHLAWRFVWWVGMKLGWGVVN